MTYVTWIAGVAIAMIIAAPAAAQPAAAIKIGGTCDRTSSTQVIGGEVCPGVADYIAWVNRKGGVLGHPLHYTEIDHAYTVPRAVEAYEELKRNGVVAFMNYGVPMLYSLTPRFMEDKIPVLNTGTGRSASIDGETWRYIFPGTAGYWSQAGVVMKYIKDNGARKGTKIAFLYSDSPAGREGIQMLEAVALREGYTLGLFAVQPPGLEMEPQVTEIVRDFKADWVFGGLFGAPVAVSIKELRRAGFPLNRAISFVYGSGEADVEAAGWDTAQGYLGLQYAAPGRNPPIVQELLKMYRDERREVPKYIGSTYYNRGVLIGALLVEGVRLATQNHGLPLTGDKVRRGYEAIRNFELAGISPPITLTPQDHEGGGLLRIYQVKGREWVPVTDWSRGYRDVVMELVKKANTR